MTTTIIALVTTTAAIIAAYVALIERTRSRNLEVQLDEARAHLDDATRERDRYRISNAHLIAEAETLAVDLACTEKERVHLAATLRRRKEAVAGTLLMQGLVREGRKLYVFEHNIP
jgi:hypothetical protein